MILDQMNLVTRAATIDEVLSTGFKSETGQKGDSDSSALRLAAWCRASSSGDWGIFAKRLARDQFAIDEVLSRFSTHRAVGKGDQATWLLDAQWIYVALLQVCDSLPSTQPKAEESIAFEGLFSNVVSLAMARVMADLPSEASANFNGSALTTFRQGLLVLLSELLAPVLYSKFVVWLKGASPEGTLLASDADTGLHHFDAFMAEMVASGLNKLLSEKPVLLRVIAVTIRQWIDTTRELVLRLQADLTQIRAQITHSATTAKVSHIGGELSDPHNFGHSVQILTFDDDTKIVYKPKDLRLDAAWFRLIEKFNLSAPPVQLKSAETITRTDYGWTEFISHTSCNDTEDFSLFYRRAGAWLAVFHVFSSSDMHYENIIASGAHPVPIDLEMILQASTPEYEQERPESLASIIASRKVANSVLMVGMLPAYSRSQNNKIFDAGGLNAFSGSKTKGTWKNINSNGMRWMQISTESTECLNIPHLNGTYAQLGTHIDVFVQGFKDYSNFLIQQRDLAGAEVLLKDFRQLPVRKVIRNTRFYYMLLQRLKDYHQMGDGIIWSAQADFLARLADWDSETDLLWPLQQAERLALLNLNVPHFVSLSDGDLVSDHLGTGVSLGATSGIARATARINGLNAEEIKWQSDVITISTSFLARNAKFEKEPSKYLFTRKLRASVSPALSTKQLSTEAQHIASVIEGFAVVSPASAAWVGLDWLGDSEVGQLVTLGPDLYNGVLGIALFLSAYAKHSDDAKAKDLALKALSGVRHQINSVNPARWARSLGIGAATGMGSVVYTLTWIAELLGDQALLDDAVTASTLISDDLIAADTALDLIGGSAGAIMGLLALHRKTQSAEVLARAVRCGEHLLKQTRAGELGSRSWISVGTSETPLNGISHGAAGFALALSKLSLASSRVDFAQAAHECISYESANYNEEKKNWPDLRELDGQLSWASQWCHGAPGIGLARIAALDCSGAQEATYKKVIANSARGTTDNWPHSVDTLCCGTLGTIELLSEAGRALGDSDLTALSDRRLAAIFENRLRTGDYQWGSGGTEFNLGFFRGLAGVGYTVLRRLDLTLPNVLVWE